LFCYERWIEQRTDLIEADTERDVFGERGANNFCEGSGKFRQSEAARGIVCGQGSGESFAEGNSQRPDIGRREKHGLRRGKWRGQRPGGSGLAAGKNAVNGKFDIVTDGVNVGGLESTVNETAFVEKIKGGKDSGQDTASFIVIKSAAVK